MIFFRKYKEYNDKELDDMDTVVSSSGFAVIKKMVEILTHNTMVENLRIQPKIGDTPDRSIARQHERFQERIYTVKTFLKEMELMAKESKKREKKEKSKKKK